MPSPKTQGRARLGLSVVIWLASWSCLMVALTQAGDPWPWGGLAIYLAIAATPVTLWCVAESVARRAVQLLCREVEVLQEDREAFPRRLARAIVDASAVSRL